MSFFDWPIKTRTHLNETKLTYSENSLFFQKSYFAIDHCLAFFLKEITRAALQTIVLGYQPARSPEFDPDLLGGE